MNKTTHPALGLILALSATACGSDDPAPSTSTGSNNPQLPQPTLPTATEACPTLATGMGSFKGLQVQLWVGERRDDVKGPVLFYWHGTGSVSAEATAFVQTQINEIVSEGGIVASFTTSLGTGQYTGPFVWYADDFGVADQILACAVEQLNIDTRRIYSAGCSAGGIQTTMMAYMRSGYIAAIMPNSGGTFTPPELQDPEHVPAVMLTHGALGSDKVVIEFAESSAATVRDIATKGGFAVKCDHGGGHCLAPPDVVTAQWQFLKDHPFGTRPSPYKDGLPSSFPAYCSIAQP